MTPAAPPGPPLPCGHPFSALAKNGMGVTECSVCRAALNKTDRLNGWKAIAAALGVDRTTAIGWHEREADRLPVRHDRKGVYASRAALERWLHAGDMPLATHAELQRLRASVPDLQQLAADVERLKVHLGAPAASPASPEAAERTALPRALGAAAACDGPARREAGASTSPGRAHHARP
jgi:hypothetical protein